VYLGSFPASQEPSCKSDNSSPSSAQVKYDWTCTFSPLMTSWQALGQLYLTLPTMKEIIERERETHHLNQFDFAQVT